MYYMPFEPHDGSGRQRKSLVRVVYYYQALVKVGV